MPKKGRFSDDEKVYVKQNYLLMSDQQMAEALDRDKNAVINFRRRNKLDKQGKATVAEGFDSSKARDDLISAMPEEDKKKSLLSGLRATSAYLNVKKSLERTEVQFYEDRYVEFMMDPTIETMTATEKDALHRKTLAEIRMHRFLEDEKIFRDTGQPNNRSREISECQDAIYKCEKSLNVTREQRLKDGQDQSINFTSIIRELNNPRVRQELGYEAAMFKWMQEVSYNENLNKTIISGDDEEYDVPRNFVDPSDSEKFNSDFLGKNVEEGISDE
jgi:hypothetical protein